MILRNHWSIHVDVEIFNVRNSLNTVEKRTLIHIILFLSNFFQG
jgi:hypothetical protein